MPTIDQSDMDFVYADDAIPAVTGVEVGKEKYAVANPARGKLEREANVEAEKRCLKRGIRISLERSDSFDEEYIADYLTKLPIDGQYKPLSSIEECVTPIPPTQLDDHQDGLETNEMEADSKCEDEITLYLGKAYD